MNFYGTLCGVVCGLLLGIFADYFKRRMKLIIIMLYVSAAIVFTSFTCMCVDILPRSKVILASFLVSSSMPLFLEITCETSYPIAEGVTTGFLGMVVNIGATVFMCIELLPNIETGWANWALVGAFVAAIPLMIAFKAEYKRVDIDIVGTNEPVL